MNTETISKVLGFVPREKAFYFFTSIGNYTGVNASSLKEFVEKINEVDIKSLEFHLYRGDFDKWIDEVLQDKDLAEEIRRLQKFSFSGNALKNQLYSIVSKRLKHLTNMLAYMSTKKF